MSVDQYRKVFFVLSGLLILTVFMDAVFGWADLYGNRATRLPIGVFTFLKLVVSSYVLILLYSARFAESVKLTTTEEASLAIILIVFQPVFDLALPRSMWLLIDAVTLGFILYLEREIWLKKFLFVVENFSFADQFARQLERVFIYSLIIGLALSMAFIVVTVITNGLARQAEDWSKFEVSSYCVSVLKRKKTLTEEEERILKNANIWSSGNKKSFEIAPDQNRNRYPFTERSYGISGLKPSNTDERVMAFEYTAPRYLYPELCSFIAPKWANGSHLAGSGELLSHGYFFAQHYKLPDYFYQLVERKTFFPNFFGIVEWTFWQHPRSSDRQARPYLVNLNKHYVYK